MDMPLRFAQLPGLRMGYVETGPRDGEPVMLLHGFPEFHHSWRLQWPALAEAGYRVIAPDQRGYNLTDKSPPYDLATLTGDVANLQDALGAAPSHIVGHDWGAVVSYEFAHRFPERVKRLAILNVPHMNAYLDSMRAGNRRQWRKSWYVYFFQIPWLPERALADRNFAFIDRAFAGVRHMTPEDLARYKAACAQPGALRAMIGWYRALARLVARTGLRPPRKVSAETLVIWGERDLALDKGTNETLNRYVPNARVEYLPEASHWVQMDEPARVNALLAGFLLGEGRSV